MAVSAWTEKHSERDVDVPLPANTRKKRPTMDDVMMIENGTTIPQRNA